MQYLNDYIYLFAIGAVLMLLERFLPMHRGQKSLRKGWKTDLMHVFASGLIIRLGVTITVILLSVMAISVVPEPVRNAIRSQPDWLEFIELLVLSDMCFYFAHRLCHSVPLLWRFHAVHHSSENLDWLATYRVHPVDQILNSTIIALPTIILGFSPVAVMLYALVYRLQSPFLHSNVGIEAGLLGRWFGRVFTTPRFHHWHHADEVQAYDRNFSGQLSIFDRIFGTYYNGSLDRLPHRYGVGGHVAEDYAGQMLKPFSSGQTQKPELDQVTIREKG